MDVFAYPTKKHKRTQRPPKFTNYRTYKPFLRIEFARRCIYCRIPDLLRGEDNFGVEHYLPKKPFDKLKTDYANLFYACNTCNRRKGRFYPTDVQRRRGDLFPNPCDFVMSQHLGFSGSRVVTKSRTGSFIEVRLQLNEKKLILQRDTHIDVVRAYESEIRRLDQAIIDAGRKIIAAKKAKKDPVRQTEIQHRFREKRTVLTQKIRSLLGEI